MRCIKADRVYDLPVIRFLSWIELFQSGAICVIMPFVCKGEREMGKWERRCGRARTSLSFFFKKPSTSTLYSMLSRQLLTKDIWIIGSDELERVPSLNHAEEECTLWVKHSNQSAQGEVTGLHNLTLINHYCIIYQSSIIIAIRRTVAISNKSLVCFMKCCVHPMIQISGWGFDGSPYPHIAMQWVASFSCVIWCDRKMITWNCFDTELLGVDSVCTSFYPKLLHNIRGVRCSCRWSVLFHAPGGQNAPVDCK